MPRKKQPPKKTEVPIEIPPVPQDILELSVRQELIRNSATTRSDTNTPNVKIKVRPDGLNYVDEAYMRRQLDVHFPEWSWLPAGDNPVQFLGSEWVVVSGNLVINDHGVQRNFFSPGSVRIQYKRNQPHTADNIIDVDKNVASANTAAFKRAINRLTHICDDVYDKQDVDLTDEQIQKVLDLMDEHNASDAIRMNVKANLNNGKVHKMNYDLMYSQLENELTKENKDV